MGNVSRLQEALEGLYANCDEMARSKSQLEISMMESTGQINQLQTEQRIRYETNISQSQQQLADLSRQNGDLLAQLDRLSHRNAELQRENDELRR